MAQLVARLNGIQKARGSNPLSSTSEDLNPLIFMGTVLGLFFLPLRLSHAPQISIGQRSSRFFVALSPRRNSKTAADIKHRRRAKRRYKQVVNCEKTRADRQAVQRSRPFPCALSFALFRLSIWRGLERRGVAEPLVYSSNCHSAISILRPIIV